jgi:hypothetical protein
LAPLLPAYAEALTHALAPGGILAVLCPDGERALSELDRRLARQTLHGPAFSLDAGHVAVFARLDR